MLKSQGKGGYGLHEDPRGALLRESPETTQPPPLMWLYLAAKGRARKLTEMELKLGWVPPASTFPMVTVSPARGQRYQTAPTCWAIPLCLESRGRLPRWHTAASGR